MTGEPPKPPKPTNAQHWLDLLPHAFPQAARGERVPPPAPPAPPPGLSLNPYTLPPRFVELLASLQRGTPAHELPPEVAAIWARMLEQQGHPMVSVCDASGQQAFMKAGRPLSQAEREALTHIYIAGIHLANAQAAILSDLSSQEERDQALVLARRIHRTMAVRTEDNEGWFRLAGALESLPAEHRAALPQLTPPDGFLMRGLLKSAGGDHDAIDRLSDAELGAFLGAWHRPRKGRSRWGEFARLCERLGVTPPAEKKAAKQVAKRALGGSKKRGP